MTDTPAPHPFDTAETITRDEDGELGNVAYYDWIGDTITAATRQPVPWLAVRLGIALDRIIRSHEAESTGGPKCAECLAIEEASR